MSDRSEMEQLEEQHSAVCSELSIWSSLQSHSGWEKLEKIAQGQINERMRVCFRTPVPSIDKVTEQEFMKGEGNGMEILLRLPQIEIDRLQAEKERLEKELEDEQKVVSDHDRADDASGVGGQSRRGLSTDVLSGDRDAFGTGSEPDSR